MTIDEGQYPPPLRGILSFSRTSQIMLDGTATAHPYRPKIGTTLSEGYRLPVFRNDLWVGLTVAVVALPLSMAIAVASGVGPERGLYATIVGGFLVSALGGSRFQVGGARGGVHSAGGRYCRAVWHGWAVAHGHAFRSYADHRGSMQARISRALCASCGDCRVHVRHRRHHLCQSVEGPRGLALPSLDLTVSRRAKGPQSRRGRRIPHPAPVTKPARLLIGTGRANPSAPRIKVNAIFDNRKSGLCVSCAHGADGWRPRSCFRSMRGGFRPEQRPQLLAQSVPMWQ